MNIAILSIQSLFCRVHWFGVINLRINDPSNRKTAEPLFLHGCRTTSWIWREALALWLFPGFLLQVFGQTPFYNVEKSQWSLWPEIPHDLVSRSLGWQRVWGRGRESCIWSMDWEREGKKEVREWLKETTRQVSRRNSIKPGEDFTFLPWASNSWRILSLYSSPLFFFYL